MSEKDNPKEVIEAYRKRQARSQRVPKVIFGLAAILLIAGAAAIIFWLTQKETPQISFSVFASDTPTPTETITPSPVPPTITPTNTPTEVPPTDTLEPSPTPTRVGPVIYIVQEGDTLYSIADQFGLDILVLFEANRERLELDPANPIIRVGDEILVPPPGTELPTATPLPEDLPPGTRIDYTVQPGDSLAAIAYKLNSTVEDIIKYNDDIEDATTIIYIGQVLVIRVNLVTPEPTEENAGATAAPPGTIATLTPTSEN